MFRRCVWIVGCTLLLLTACDSDEPGPARPDSGGSPPVGMDAQMPLPDATPPSTGPFYYEDIRPILVENCNGCHTEGGVAPFPLETYAQAAEVSERMREVTRDRIMPPFLADNSGDCNTWANFRGLTQEEIDRIGAWVDNGRQMGDPSIEAPMPVPLPTLPERGTRTRVTMPSSYIVDESEDDDYRCFVVDLDPVPTTDMFMTGFQVYPGNEERVHHLIVYNPTSRRQANRARELDAESPEPGYPCFGGPRVGADPLVLWAPGVGATVMPQHNGTQTGIRVAAGRTQIIQMHYNNIVGEDVPTDDLSTVEMNLETGAIESQFIPLAHQSMELAPRLESVETTYRVRAGEPPLDFSLPFDLPVYGALPHMHTLGRSLTVTLNDECAVDVPRWDFNWQMAYFLDTPLRIGNDDEVVMTCRYNTMSRDETVFWGDGTQDEMCLVYFYVVFSP